MAHPLRYPPSLRLAVVFVLTSQRRGKRGKAGQRPRHGVLGYSDPAARAEEKLNNTKPRESRWQRALAAIRVLF